MSIGKIGNAEVRCNKRNDEYGSEFQVQGSTRVAINLEL